MNWGLNMSKEMTVADIIRVDEKSPELLYMQIVESVRNAMHDGLLKPGEKLPTELELAKLLGISPRMVGKAMSILVDAGLVYRRRQRGTIIADYEPGEVSRTRTSTIGVVGCLYLKDIAEGIQDQLREHDYHMYICDCNNDMTLEASNVNSLVDRGVDGLIIFPVMPKKGVRQELAHYRRLRQAKIPFVLIDRFFKSVDTDYVVFDNRGGVKEAVTYLIGLNHKRIGYIGTPYISTSIADRLQGYKDALKSASIPVDEAVIKDYDPQVDDMGQVIDEMLKQDISAIFCMTDVFALKAYQALLNRGFRIPEDISIMGFGSKEHMNIFLTTVAEPSYEMGATATKILFDKILNGENETRHIVLNTELSIGGSTMPAK